MVGVNAAAADVTLSSSETADLEQALSQVSGLRYSPERLAMVDR